MGAAVPLPVVEVEEPRDLQKPCTSSRFRGIVRPNSAFAVNQARYSEEKWRVLSVDMRERGAKLTDEELERLVEWSGRVRGTNQDN